MGPLVFALPGNEGVSTEIARFIGGDMGMLETRNFPDGETYIRFRTDPAGRKAILVCTLNRPDEKFLPLSFAASTARDLGAQSLGLVARAVPAGDGVSGRHQARHDESAHRAQTYKSEIHVASLPRKIVAAVSTDRLAKARVGFCGPRRVTATCRNPRQTR